MHCSSDEDYILVALGTYALEEKLFLYCSLSITLVGQEKWERPRMRLHKNLIVCIHL